MTKDGEIRRKYQYDAYGNRIRMEGDNIVSDYSYNALNQLISKSDIMAEGQTEEQFCYDKRGNLVQILLDGQVQNQYVYGPLNRMEQAWNITREEVRYVYDGLGHRIGRQELHSARNTDYIIDLTRRYHNLLQKEEEGERQTFLWDDNVTGIIEADLSHKCYFQDELGSPVRIADDEGKIRETYDYDEFGQDLYPNQGQVQPFGYTGYQSEGTAGMYYAQTREYMPSAGRFASRDQDRFIYIQNIQSINLYNYCMSNPVRYTDPMGYEKGFRNIWFSIFGLRGFC